MSIKYTCDDKQTLIAYLYGEVDQETRQAIGHVASGHARGTLVLTMPQASGG